VRRGDNAHSMYFLAGSKVDIQLAGRCITLGVGHFFGEIAVLRCARRSATGTATARTNPLVLDASDFHMLIEREKRIAEPCGGARARRPRGDVAQEPHLPANRAGQPRRVTRRWAVAAPYGYR
jgi:hypothetical protein